MSTDNDKATTAAVLDKLDIAARTKSNRTMKMQDRLYALQLSAAIDVIKRHLSEYK